MDLARKRRLISSHHMQMHHGPGRGQVEAASGLTACPVIVQKGENFCPEGVVPSGRLTQTKWLPASSAVAVHMSPRMKPVVGYLEDEAEAQRGRGSE